MSDEYNIYDTPEEVREEVKHEKPDLASGGSTEKENNWDGVFAPLSIDDTGLIRNTKRYLMTGTQDVSEVAIEKGRSIATSLLKLGYTLRSTLNGDRDKLNAVATVAAMDKCEIYLPWYKYGSDEKLRRSAVLKQPSKTAYEIATKYSRVFDSLKPVVRAFIARDVHVVLGLDCNTPIDFLLCYSDDGAETKQEVSAKTGNIGNYIRLCDECNIPVFNLRKEGAIDERFKGFIKSINLQP